MFLEILHEKSYNEYKTPLPWQRFVGNVFTISFRHKFLSAYKQFWSVLVAGCFKSSCVLCFENCLGKEDDMMITINHSLQNFGYFFSFFIDISLQQAKSLRKLILLALSSRRLKNCFILSPSFLFERQTHKIVTNPRFKSLLWILNCLVRNKQQIEQVLKKLEGNLVPVKNQQVGVREHFVLVNKNMFSFNKYLLID